MAAVPLEASIVITAWNRSGVVDDGSTDDTAQVAEGFGEPVRVLRQHHAGAAAALNTGVAQATGDVVAFLDSDDLWLPRKLELQLAALKSDPDVEIVYGWAEMFACPTLSAAERARICIPQKPVEALGTSCLAIRAATLRRVGPFAEYRAPTLDWLNRARELSVPQRCLGTVLIRRRLHRGSMNFREREQLRRSYVEVAKAALDRRRRTCGRVAE
jgi:glycosyltransferase involved in cell wall biosynthesis